MWGIRGSPGASFFAFEMYSIIWRIVSEKMGGRYQVLVLFSDAKVRDLTFTQSQSTRYLSRMVCLRAGCPKTQNP